MNDVLLGPEFSIWMGENMRFVRGIVRVSLVYYAFINVAIGIVEYLCDKRTFENTISESLINF